MQRAKLQEPCRRARRAIRPVPVLPRGSLCSTGEQARVHVAQGNPAVRGAVAPSCWRRCGAALRWPPAWRSRSRRWNRWRSRCWRVAATEGESSPGNGGVVTESVIVRERDRIWLVGSGPTPAHGAALACAIENALGRKVTDVVNTRAHPELAMGNTAFGSARVWALHDVAQAMEARCRECLTQLAQRVGGARLDDSAIRVPDQRIGADGAGRGQLGPFLWWALPRAAGERALVLRLRGQPIVIAQGLVWPGRVPNLRGTESALMLRSLQQLRGIAKGATLVLGEQGAVGSLDDISNHMDYIVSLRAAVQARVKAGTEENAGLASLTLPMFSQRIGSGEIDTLNRQRVWREIEASLFR